MMLARHGQAFLDRGEPCRFRVQLFEAGAQPLTVLYGLLVLGSDQVEHPAELDT